MSAANDRKEIHGEMCVGKAQPWLGHMLGEKAAHTLIKQGDFQNCCVKS